MLRVDEKEKIYPQKLRAVLIKIGQDHRKILIGDKWIEELLINQTKY